VPELAVGTEVSGTYDALEVLPDAPAFTVSLAQNQATLVAPGMKVDIEAGDNSWSAVVGSVRPASEAGTAQATLAGVGKTPVCGEDCDDVPVAEPSTFEARIHVVPDQDGITVPAAAVVTVADGSTGVTLEDGAFAPVTVVASASGMAAVEGIDPGATVRTPGEQP
jgi:hypothetical protein